MKNIGYSASTGSGFDEAQIARTKSWSGSASSSACVVTAKPASRAFASSVSSAASVSSWLQRSRSSRQMMSGCAVWRTTITVSTRGGSVTRLEAIAMRTRAASALLIRPSLPSVISARPTPRITSDRSTETSPASVSLTVARIVSVSAGASSRSVSARIASAVATGT